MRQAWRQHALHTLLLLGRLLAPLFASFSAPRVCTRCISRPAVRAVKLLAQNSIRRCRREVAYLDQSSFLLLFGGLRAVVCCCEGRYSRGGQEGPQQAFLAGGAQLQAEALAALLRLSGSWGQLLRVESSCRMQQVPGRSLTQAPLCPSGPLFSV